MKNLIESYLDEDRDKCRQTLEHLLENITTPDVFDDFFDRFKEINPDGKPFEVSLFFYGMLVYTGLYDDPENAAAKIIFMSTTKKLIEVSPKELLDRIWETLKALHPEGKEVGFTDDHGFIALVDVAADYAKSEASTRVREKMKKNIKKGFQMLPGGNKRILH